MNRVPSHTAVRRTQRGAALIVLAVILVLGTSGVLLSALNVASRNAEIAQRADSARALLEAKQALLGYLASQAATDSNPGRLPCPEAPSYFGTANAGLSQNDKLVNIANPVGGYCGAGTVVGRLPWRTLGISKLVDAHAEPLWYVISPGFALPSLGGALSINSNTPAQLTLDGAGAAAVALIIAPGAAMNVQAATGCIVRAQARTAETAVTPPAPDLRDYLECDNATSPADASFVTAGAAASYNDQVLRISHAELFDVVEPVVAKRIETQIASVLPTVYIGGTWNNTDDSRYPFAAPFTNPQTSTFTGSPGTYFGLLPVAQANPGSIVWNNPTGTTVTKLGGTLTSYDCLSSNATRIICRLYYPAGARPTIEIVLNAANIGSGFRQPPGLQANVFASGFSTQSIANSLDDDGGAVVTYRGRAPMSFWSGSGVITVNIEINAADHSITDQNNAATGWFLRNAWHTLVYYGISQGFAPGAEGECGGGGEPACLTVSNATAPNDNKRAILFLTGHAFNFQARGTSAQLGNLVNYFEDTENRDGDPVFVKNRISKTYNDHVVMVDPNP